MFLCQGEPRLLLARLFEPERRAWRGEASLATTFWGYGILASSALIALHIRAYMLQSFATEQVLIIVSGLYTAWVLLAIWRCAAHAHPYWGTLARWLTVAWALNCGLVLAFLQIDLLIRNFVR